jgi:hypothetical protein
MRDEQSSLLPRKLTSAQREHLLRVAVHAAWLPQGQVGWTRAQQALADARTQGWVTDATNQVSELRACFRGIYPIIMVLNARPCVILHVPYPRI